MTLQTMKMEQVLRIARCDRCGRKVRNDRHANTVFKAGAIAGFLCGRCQTADESLEAQINEATIDYATTTTDAFGRAVVSPKRVQG